ncbi:MAG TPA: sulfatase-like hydrolase/transferase [Gaiellaceae bacterium]
MARARPNVLVVVADDMGYGDFGLFNDGRSRTPHLNDLARQGLCLTQHYSGSPVCAPARAALLTGRYPHRTGAIDTLQGRGLDRISLAESTIADLFRGAGYRTGLVGKWHNGALDPRFHPKARGFEEFVGFSGGWSDYWDYVLDANGTELAGDGRYLTDVLTEHALDFIARHRRRPFFLVVAYNAPHFPMQAPDDLIRPYLEAGETLGAAVTYAMLEALDAGVGRLDEALHDHALADDTLVVFTSDNGPYLGDVWGVSLDRFNFGLRGAKHYVYEGGIRVPAVFRWPAGVDGGRLVPEMLHFTDWLPTLAGAAGIDVPPALALDGHDVLDVLRGESGAVDPVRFWQNNRYEPRIESNAAMRDGPWKLVRPAIPETFGVDEADRIVDRGLNQRLPDRVTSIQVPPRDEPVLENVPPPFLFNVEDDPFEQHDLAAAHPERARSMTAALEAWFESVEADRRRGVF